MDTTVEFDVVVSDLTFPEGPRWHNGSLWFSDMHDSRVVRWAPDAGAETVMEMDDCPSGLGFLPDGDLLVVAMHARKIMRVDGLGAVSEYADLSGIATWHANDMLVDPEGFAFVGNFGDATAPPEPITPAKLALVRPDGSVVAVADDLALPNGMVLLNGGRTLLVAETRALPPRISAFTVADDRSLSDRRVVITLQNELPDGMSADNDGNIWFASPFTSELIKISPDGDVLARLVSPRPPYACVVGGDRGNTLYVCAADDWIPEVCREKRTGAILAADITGV